MAREYHYCWTWDLAASPEQLWPLVADTNRFDRDAGVPPVDLRTDGTVLPVGRAQVRVRQYGVALDYVQDPFEWDAPHHFSVARRFSTGPLATLRIRARLEPIEGGTRLTYEVWATPRNVLGHSIPVQIGVVLRRRFDHTFRTYATLASTGEADRRTGGRVRLAPHAAERLDALRAEATGVEPAVLDRLIEVVRVDDDVAVGRLRPYALADRWGLDRRTLLEACLVATRLGLLRFRWDVLCPMCRLAKGTTEHLAELPEAVHCEACHVDVTTNFARSVELTFAPSPSLRTVDEHEYCIGNPAATPHIVAQALLGPGEQLEVGPLSVPGRYRVRAADRPGVAHLQVAADPVDTPTEPPDGPGVLEVRLAEEGWPGAELTVGAGGRVRLRNDSATEQLLLVERTSWGDDAVTAAEVTALARFRDLFADEALRPGAQVEVGVLTIAFTDLCDSTALYQRIGDAVAFGRVLDHFTVLERCIEKHGGAIVKTIGDAVMAVFADPAAALAALLEAQAELRASAGGAEPLRLKAGLHTGPCIAVTLNERLDYFGTTVNLAARLEGCAAGDDVVLSAETHDDPGVAALLAGTAGLRVEPRTAALKGFAGERAVWRVVPDLAGTAGPAAALSPSASSG